MSAAYTAQDLVDAVTSCGIKAGDVIFVHSNVGYSGRMDGVRSLDELCAKTVEALLEVTGPEGTLVVPTFSYSFGSDKPERRYDPAETPSACGALSEYLRKLPEAVRSAEPMFSVAAVGAKKDELTRDVSAECFGAGSFWERFLDADGKVCNLNFDAGSTFIHHVERKLGVPYRQDRPMSGEIWDGNGWIEAEFVFFCRDMNDPGATARFELFDKLAREAEIVATQPVGRGSVVVISARDTEDFIRNQITRTPDFLTSRGMPT
ncbi:AAC(3) family N-acetyltransferase [Roseibium porphyridii]|uniref:Aminoglycoside N(3)-acetyltransferase n=1 Tax=Roseibium porphyridii TaxID=2866279 RepID=A0ABY8F1K0_9HYPH|nr:AAC(3) family N-acetyltransferase [Roseibium sp. KMA01]WFE89353.1 AAC(3) family N-acetyltransferase [Roseibium sp. KMA01]